MPDALSQVLNITRQPWDFTAGGLVILLEKVIQPANAASSTNELKLRVCHSCAASECSFASFADATHGFLMNFVPCSSACSCAGGNELPIFFSKFAFQLSADAASRLITRPLLLKSSILCAEVRQLLQRTLSHAQSSGSVAACRASLEKFGSVLRSISCSVSHLILQIIMHTDDSVHGSCACAPLLHELLLLAQFLQVCLDLPSVAGSYSSYLSFSPPHPIDSFLSPDTTPAMTLPQKFSSLLLKQCENNLQRVFVPGTDNSDTLHMLLSAAKILQLFSSPNVALFPRFQESPLATSSTTTQSPEMLRSSREEPSSDDSYTKLLGGSILRVSDAAWGTGILASELHLFAMCLLPVFVSFRDRAACGMKEFTHKIAVQSDCVTRCIALADWSARKSLDVGGSAGVYASAAFAFFRALGPMVAALSALNQHAAAPSWKCSVDSQKSDCGGSLNVASKSEINERSSAFFSELELWRGDPRAHIAADRCGVSLNFSENLKNFLSAWIVGGSAGGLRGLIERHAPVLSSTEQFADNLHRTLYFCANECHPSAAQPGIEYCAYLLNAAAVSNDSCLNFDGPCSAIFDGVARYFAHGLREIDFIDSLNGNDPTPSIRLRLHHVLADIQSTQNEPLKLMSPYAAAAFLTALCRTQGFSRKTLPLLPTASLAERCTCSVGLKHIWSRTFVALQQSESCRATLLLRNVLCCIVVHDSFYFGSVCQGIKDVNLLQPSSLVDSMFFATTRASASFSSNFSDVIAGLSVLLADLRTLCSTSCSIPTHSCDSMLQQMFSMCVIANKNLACAFRRTDCIDMASVKLSALWSDDALFNAETWTPHPIFKFICSEMMPFLLDYASKNHLLHADTTCSFKLDDWCHVLLLILSNINIIRRCPPCPAEMQLLFSGVFPILDFVSDSTSLQPLLQLLVDVVSISLQPALISSTCSIMKIVPIPHISTSFFRSVFKMLIRVCRERLQVGSGVCQLVAQSFVELLFQSFNATMTQQRASTAKRMYSLWQDLDPQSQFKTKHHNLDLIVRAEIWPIVLTHSLDIDFVIWSEHIGLMCTEGFEELFVLMSSCPTAAGPGSQTFDVVVETISSLVTFSAQNLVISIFDTSMPQSSIAAAEAMFMHICERIITQISELEESVLHVMRNSLVQMTSIFSAASSRTLGPSKFLHGRAFSATHVFSGCDKLALTYDSIATQFEDHVVFDKDLDVNTLFMPLFKKKDASTVLLDSIHIFLRDCGVVLPLLLSSGLSLHTREYCRVPKNCKPSLLVWLRWLASSPYSKDASSAVIAQDILLLLPDPDNFLTINVRPSVSYRSMKNRLHSLSTSQSSFESALHSIVDSSFYASPSLSLLTNCSPKGKFCIFRAAYIEAISLPSEFISKSFSFLLFLLGRPGQRINMSNPAVQQGLFPTEDVIKSKFHSRLEQLIKDLLYAADFESLPGDPTSNASAPALQVFTPKAGSSAKASLLMEFLSSSPCITAIYHDLLALEFLLLRPPHMDYDNMQESYHCASFLNDLFNHIKLQQADHRIRYSPAVVKVFDFVDLATKAVVDVGNWIDAITSVANTDAVMWLVNSRLIIYFHRHVNLCFDVLSPLIAAVDASALPVNISTLCGLFGVLFRLLSVIIQWKLNINTESALTTCTSFLKCIARYQDGFSDNAYSKTPIMRRNCQVSDISLFSESVRAATHMLSLLFTNDNISTRDVVTHISQVLNALHRVQPVVSSDFVLTTVANVCSRAVGIAPENILKNGNVLQGTKEYQSIPTKVILLKIRELLVALCGGASIAMSKCATALSLLLFTQPNCPVLSIQDRKIVANVCALALQVNFSTEAESLILMNYQVWNAAAGLARSLLALSAGPDEFEQSSAVISSFLHAVPVIVQSLGFMLQNEPGPYETLSDTALVAFCCENGIKLLNSLLRILASGPVRIESIITNAFLSLLKFACSANVSSIDLRNQISGQVRKFYRSRWVGIANLGNTCYAASVVQLLVSIPSFISVLFESSFGPLAGNPSQTLFRSLQGFSIEMSDLSQNQSPFLQPHDLYSRCIISSSNVLQIADTTAQSQDAAEFFVAIMNQLNVETSLNTCLDTASSSPRMCAAALPVISSRVADLFAVSITEKCDWPACGCSRKQTEDSVLLPAEGLVTLDASGKSFSSIDAVLASHFSSNHTMRCCSCDTEQATQCTATKRITRVSDILVLQLRCNTSDGAYVKIFEQPSFPLHLDVRHVTDAVNETEYELEGVVLHHGLNMSTGHYTVLVRHKCASDHIWGLHLNDAKVPEHVTHSVMSDITSRDGRRIDLEKGNLVYSGKPYLLFYVRKHHQRAQPAMAFLTDDFFNICKIASTSLCCVERSMQDSMRLQALRCCIHVATACVHLGQPSLRRLQLLFSKLLEGVEVEILDVFVPDLIEAVDVGDSASLFKSMLPFYVMTLSQSRRPELVASFKLHPQAPLSILNCSPSEFCSSFFVALVSSAHVLPSNLDCFCSPLVEILNGVTSQMLYNIGSGGNGQHSVSISHSVHFTASHYKPASFLSATRAAAAALIHFRLINGPHLVEDEWLSGLAEKTGVERVCHYFECSGAVLSLAKATHDVLQDAGLKRPRDQSNGGPSVQTVWEQLDVVYRALTSSSTSDAESL